MNAGNELVCEHILGILKLERVLTETGLKEIGRFG